MSEDIRLHHKLEQFLYREAQLLDEWQLDDWLALWVDGEVEYQIGPVGESDGETAEPHEVLFLVSDNRYRLGHRILRMQKTSAHAENPRSIVRRLISNVQQVSNDGCEIHIVFNELVSRTQSGVSALYPAKVLMWLAISDDSFRIKKKKILLNLDYLKSPGNLTIFM